jgi:YVTN family beta-propeller protein
MAGKPCPSSLFLLIISASFYSQSRLEKLDITNLIINNVYLIDIAADSVVGTVPVGVSPYDVLLQLEMSLFNFEKLIKIQI